MNRREWLLALGGVSPGLLHAVRQRGSPEASHLNDPTTLSIAELGAALAAGRLTPVEITAAYLARIEQQNDRLGALVTVTRDRANDDTRRLMAALNAGTRRGELAAVPVAHKDLFATRGIRTTGGSRLHEQWVPERDAEVVARLAAAGTVLVGKTNTHELGGGVTTINPFFGTTHNPRDLTRIPGGSSGGSAAAVSARLALVATGSDTGGSARIPAAFCGCVGFKPTFGLVSTAGLLGACRTFDHVGVLARSAEDAMRVVTAIATADDARGFPGGPPVTFRAARGRAVKGLRVGVPRRFFFDDLSPGVARAVATALERLRAAGAVVGDVDLPVSHGLYDSMFAPIAVSEIRATYAADWLARPAAFSKDFASVFGGPGPTAAAVANARDARLRFELAVTAVLADVDVLAMPTVPLEAPRIDAAIDGMRILRNTWPFNAARVPAVSVPCGDGEGSLPVGLQLVGRMYDDARLLAVADAVQHM